MLFTAAIRCHDQGPSFGADGDGGGEVGFPKGRVV